MGSIPSRLEAKQAATGMQAPIESIWIDGTCGAEAAQHIKGIIATRDNPRIPWDHNQVSFSLR